MVRKVREVSGRGWGKAKCHKAHGMACCLPCKGSVAMALKVPCKKATQRVLPL